MSAPATPPGPGYSMPQHVRLSADGNIFYVADLAAGSVWLISARTFTAMRFLHAGAGAHGLMVSWNGKDLYISNRAAGSISVLDFAASEIVHTWRIPSGG